MDQLPDGSGFFIAEFGPRDPGIINWLKYRPQGCCRAWLYLWRMYRSSLELSHQIGEPMTRWQAFQYALMITKQFAL